MAPRLDPRQVAKFRTRLEERQKVVQDEIRRVLLESDQQHHVDLAGVGDLEDHALADLLVDEGLAEIHQHVQEYRAIDAALMRMEGSHYGVCVDCGGDIDVERLEVYPTAVRCLDCQALYERTHPAVAPHSL